MEFTIHITPAFCYLLIVLFSAILRYPIAVLAKSLASFDSYNGASFYYAPGIRAEFSVPYRATDFYTWNPRQLILTWILFPFIPLYWAFQVWLILMYLICRLECFLTYGKDLNAFRKKYPEKFN